jgi:Tfp pilus assembly protein PilO
MATKWQQTYSSYRNYIRNIALIYQNRQDIKIFTELLLSLVTITIFSIFAIRPTLVTVGTLYSEKKEKIETIATLDKKIDNLIAAEDLFSQEKDRIALLNLSIPTETSPETLIRQTEGLAKKNNTTLTGFTLANATIIGDPAARPETPLPGSDQQQNAPIPTNPNSFPVSITATGSYTSLKSLLSNIESTRRPIYPEEVTLKISDNIITLLVKGESIYIHKSP